MDETVSATPDATAPVPNEDGAPDAALHGLALLARFHGIAADPQQLAHELGCGAQPFDDATLLLAAKRLGLKARIGKQPAQRIGSANLPALAWSHHDDPPFLIARVLDGGSAVLIHDLQHKRPHRLTREQFEQRYAGRLLQVASRASVLGELARFDFTWFVPAVIKYRRLLGEVFVVSLFIQLFALVTPLFYQVVMDKVLVHHAMTTLNVVAIGLLTMAVFDVVMNGLRTYVFAHTTSKIDVELGARLFRHVLNLPLAWFESRRVGDTIARVRELDSIRQFLTGQALTSVLDLLFTGVFLAVMLWYSGWLTLIVLLSLPLYALISAGITPVLRRRLDEKFARGADNQSFLVETVSGIGTVKATAVAPRMTRTWDSQLAGYVAAGFRVTKVATLGQQAVQLVQKLVSVAILYVGAQLVIDNTLTLGQLIAFNMLSGQVTAPIIRLAQLWQDFQQVGISVKRLGDILNTRTEIPGSRMALPPIQGRVTFERVAFRYRPDAPEVLRGIDLDIRAGEVIGIVGRSGRARAR